MAWLFQSEFDSATTAALWSLAAAAVTTIVIFIYTIGLRVATNVHARRRRRLVARWRTVFASSALSEEDARHQPLPSIRHRERTDLVEEWNRIRGTVAGSAARNLIALAVRLSIPSVATRLLRRQSVKSKILAVQTLGHLRDRRHRDLIRGLVDHDHAALSITAAVALADIDPDDAMRVLVPMIAIRRDWPRTRVSLFLRMAGSARISEPMCSAIRSADDDAKIYLLQFAQLVDASILDSLVDELIKGTNDAGVLNAALKYVTGFAGVSRIVSLAHHEAWFVRMQAAKVLGKYGSPEHLSLLESLLGDREWWVRYRAAQAIVSLPFLGPNRLRQIHDTQTDRFAADILRQVFAEAGLA